ncbi:MAG: ATP-binding protein [Bacteroidetes bacterium HGW-Bacteroidetes-17]|nr:MAG: ATP-binding protein [Bacteroidetes bacterium HGW-Bacteroidetes-17]
MVYNQFNFRIVFRIILIGLTSILFSWSLYQEHLQIARFTFLGLFILQIFMLINYIKNSNRRFARFMELIKNQGLMERFEQINAGDSNEKLNQLYNEIIQLIANSKLEKEGEHLYFLQTLEIIGTSIISVDEHGKIDLINKAARELLNIENIRTINQLRELYPDFVAHMDNLKNNEQSLFKLKVGSEMLMLNISCSCFKNQDKNLRLYSFQNISTELDNEELDAWQKLIKVMRHEIMNSITPIHSLTNTIIRLLSDNKKAKTIDQLSSETIEKALEGLNAIDKRNQGLLKFVESYRNLTKIPLPVFEKVEVSALFDSINILFSEELKSKGIKLISIISTTELILTVDEKLITQVLINLIKNSIDALSGIDNGQIIIEAFRTDKNEVLIQIKDNGIGISKDEIDKIYIPFYTTKENGSGIGLSLSRQIVRMNKGSISVQSIPGKETIFSLKF